MTHLVRRLLAVVVVVAALAVVGLRTSHGAEEIGRLRGTDAAVVAAQQNALFGCLEHELHQRVPTGTRVYVGPQSDLWVQRLVEWSTPDLPVASAPGDAAVALAVRIVHGAPCAGYALTVTRLR